MNRTPREDLLEDLNDLEFAKGFVAEHIKSDFGVKLYFARKQAELTQAQLAEKAGVTKAYIIKLERGEGNPKVSTIGAILASLGYNIETKFVKLNKKGGLK